MKFKKNLILLIVLAVLALIVVLVEKPFEDKNKKAREEAGPLFPELQATEVKKIEVKRAEDVQPVFLKKLDNAWFVFEPEQAAKDEDEASVDNEPEKEKEAETNQPAEAAAAASGESYPADKSAVDEALEKLKKIKAANLASRSREKHELFEVVPEKGIQVAAYGPDDQELARLLIGKEGPDFFSTYVRKGDDDNVYIFQEFLKGSFDRQANNWRDRRVFDFAGDDVTTLKITKKEETITLRKDETSTWSIVEPKECPADSAAVTRLVTSLATLKATNFADAATLEDSGLADPATQIAVTFKDDSAKTLLIGNKKEENYYYIKAADKKYIYEVYKSVVDKFMPSLAELEKQEAPPEEPGPGKSRESLPAAPEQPAAESKDNK